MKSINKIAKWTIIVFSFLLPLTFIPLFVNPFETPKLILGVIATSILFILYVIRVITKKSLEIKYSVFDIILFLFSLLYLLTGIFVSDNPMEAFMLPGSASFIIFGFLIYFLGKQFIKVDDEELALSIFISTVLISVISLLIYLGALEQIPQLKAIIANRESFSLIGGRLAEIIYLLIALPIGVTYLIKEEETLNKVFFGSSILFVIIAITINILSFKTENSLSLRLNNFPISWNIMSDSIKNNPLFGVGPANYLTAFNMYLPVIYNNNENFISRFTGARNLPLNIGTETGLVGLAFIAFIIFLVAKKPFKISSILLVLAALLSPFNQTLVFLFFIILLLEKSSGNKEISSKEIADYLLIGIAILAVLILGTLSYFSTRAIKAEVNYKKGLDAISVGNGKKAYDILQIAINQNPYVDRYHLTYSQVNFAIATSLSKKTDITAEEKSTVATLIQQSIREAKTTISLNQKRSAYWEHLGKIYQSIMPFTEGASGFAIESYKQAVVLDPTNPNLRIALGGIYYAIGNYDEAIKTFELAILAKPDLANSHYNLSAAYREKGEINNAIKEMETVIALSKDKDNDLKVAENELNNLKSKKLNTDFKETDNLTSPDSQ